MQYFKRFGDKYVTMRSTEINILKSVFSEHNLKDDPGL